MSRWTMPRAWAAASARATAAAIRAACRGGSGPAPAQDRGEVLAVDELHDDERAGRVLAVVVDGDDVRVGERRGRLGLLAEAGEEVGVAQVLGAEELDGDVAAELGVAGPVDRRHAALSEQLDQPVATAEDRADLRQTVRSVGRAPDQPGRVAARHRTRRRRRPALADGRLAVRARGPGR